LLIITTAAFISGIRTKLLKNPVSPPLCDLTLTPSYSPKNHDKPISEVYPLQPVTACSLQISE